MFDDHIQRVYAFRLKSYSDKLDSSIFGGSRCEAHILINMCPSHCKFSLKAVASDISYFNISPSPFPRVSNLCPLQFSSFISRQHFLTYPKLYTHWQTSVRDM